MRYRHTLVLMLLAVLPPACSGSGSSGGAFEDKCAIACKPPAGPCSAQDPAECQTQCTTLTDGLAVACAQCMIEHSGWSGTKCTASCTDCCPCGFGPSSGDTCEGGTGCSCSAADEKCEGFAIGAASDSDCKAACATK